MQKSRNKDKELCLNFCAYYKPGRNENLMCQGYLVVQELRRKGKGISCERPARMVQPDANALRKLVGRVCGKCAFREHDCDYAATSGTAPACGGLALLLHLVGSGELGPDEIE